MKKSKVQIFRLVVQLFFLGVVTIAAFRHQILGGGPKGSPPIDGICPFGGIEALYKFIIYGEFIDKLDYSNFALLIGTIILAIAAGRYFCGWICALGTMQELFGKLGQKLFKKTFVIPEKIDKYLRYIKYAVLVWAVYFTWKTATLFVRPYDPFAAYAHIPAGFGELIEEFAVGFAILVISLAASMFYDRFFCKYLCPLGGFLGILSKVSIFKIKREKESCINCNLCTKKCPVNIPVAKIDEVKSAECIGCLECVTVCPTEKGTMKITVAGKVIKPITIAVIGLVIYLGIVAAANISGYWHTEKSLTEIATKGGKLDAANIKGYMTMKDIADTYKIDILQLYTQLGITLEQVPPDTMAKNAGKKIGKSEEEFGPELIRSRVAAILGQTYIGSEKHGEAEEEEEKHEAIESDNVEKVTVSVAESAESTKPNPQDIKGTMTIKEVADTYKIDIEEIYKIIGKSKNEIPETTKLRELKESIDGFEVQVIRDKVEELQK